MKDKKFSGTYKSLNKCWSTPQLHLTKMLLYQKDLLNAKLKITVLPCIFKNRARRKARAIKDSLHHLWYQKNKTRLTWAVRIKLGITQTNHLKWIFKIRQSSQSYLSLNLKIIKMEVGKIKFFKFQEHLNLLWLKIVNENKLIEIQPI